MEGVGSTARAIRGGDGILVNVIREGFRGVGVDVDIDLGAPVIRGHLSAASVKFAREHRN